MFKVYIEALDSLFVHRLMEWTWMERARKRLWPCSEPHPWTGPWIWWRFARRIPCCPGKWLVSIHLWVITYLSTDAVRAGNVQSGVTPNIPRCNNSGADLFPFKSTHVILPALFWSKPITVPPPLPPPKHMLGQCSTCRTGSCEQKNVCRLLVLWMEET